MPTEVFRGASSITEDAAPVQSGTENTEDTLRAGDTEYVMIGGIVVPVGGLIDAFSGLLEESDGAVSSSEEFRSG